MSVIIDKHSGEKNEIKIGNSGSSNHLINNEKRMINKLSAKKLKHLTFPVNGEEIALNTILLKHKFNQHQPKYNTLSNVHIKGLVELYNCTLIKKQVDWCEYYDNIKQKHIYTRKRSYSEQYDKEIPKSDL